MTGKRSMVCELREQFIKSCLQFSNNLSLLFLHTQTVSTDNHNPSCNKFIWPRKILSYVSQFKKPTINMLNYFVQWYKLEKVLKDPKSNCKKIQVLYMTDSQVRWHRFIHRKICRMNKLSIFRPFKIAFPQMKKYSIYRHTLHNFVSQWSFSLPNKIWQSS